MRITRSPVENTKGASDWFTGTVYMDALATPSDAFRVQAMSVHFAPGARTAWHSHPFGQTLHVTDGICLAQRRGGPIETIHAGDSAFFEPGEEHWHGATPDRFMTHLAVHQVDDQGSPASWGEQVTDEEYGADRADK